VQRKSEKDVKLFVALVSILMIAVAAVTVGSYSGYRPDPSSVAITGFVLLLTVLITALWYREKYPGYSRAD
jgi:hypothetical protein